MKKVKTGVLIMMLMLLGGSAAWLLRGVYDRQFMMNGLFHVVSCTDQDQQVGLRFPSGKHVGFNLKKGGSFSFMLPQTGEGSIDVSIDGVPRDRIGYVTSMNGMVVLGVGEKRTEFSQIFPSLVLDQPPAGKPIPLNDS